MPTPTPTKTKTKPAVVKYVEGNLFENIKGLTNIVIPHVVNSVGLWGSGFVIPLGRAFPTSQQSYLDWHKGRTYDDHPWAQIHPGAALVSSTGPFALGETQFVFVDDKIGISVANMVAQHGVGGPPRPLRYNALVKCMEHVATKLMKVHSIHAPLFGSALSMGRWEFIAELIHDIWIDRNIPVTIHYLPGQLPEGLR